MKKIIVFFLLAAITFNLAAQHTYTAVDAGSKVHFVIKNFGIKTGGDFTGLSGNVNFDPANLSGSSFNVSVKSNTVNTDNNTRDKHLKKEEYFDVDKYPTINFKSTKIITSSAAGKFYVVGNLTIKSVTKVVQFIFDATPKDGGYLFAGSFDINRRDFGVGGSSISLNDKLTVTLSVFAKK
jgi:polyisoprenoid-binding protein YceI